MWVTHNGERRKTVVRVRLLAALLAGASVSGAALVTTAQAQQTLTQFNIAPQSLSSAITTRVSSSVSAVR